MCDTPRFDYFSIPQAKRFISPIASRRNVRIITVSPPRMDWDATMELVKDLRYYFTYMKIPYFTVAEMAGDRLHWHGMIDIEERYMLVDELKKKFKDRCFIDIQCPKVRMNWVNYCIKDIKCKSQFTRIGKFSITGFKDDQYSKSFVAQSCTPPQGTLAGAGGDLPEDLPDRSGCVVQFTPNLTYPEAEVNVDESKEDNFNIN